MYILLLFYSYKLFLLHSSISTHDQNKVFDTMPDGVRKLVNMILRDRFITILICLFSLDFVY